MLVTVLLGWYDLARRVVGVGRDTEQKNRRIHFVASG
jgi:hypothetical protein